MKKFILIILFMILMYSVGGIYYIEYVYKDNNEPVIKNLAEIEGYPYSLKSNASKLYKDEFNILKDNLENNYNEEEYIKSISKLYIIDLYSLKNKLNKYDINVDFIYPDIVSNYRLNIENTLYKYLENNSDGNRNQELPVVSNVIIDEILDEKYSLNKENVPCKKVKVTIEYENDLGYDKSAVITLVKQDKYYYIVEYN